MTPPQPEVGRHTSRAVAVTVWRDYFERLTTYDKGSSALRQAWNVATKELLGGRVGKWDDWAWIDGEHPPVTASQTVTDRHSVTPVTPPTVTSRHSPLKGCDGVTAGVGRHEENAFVFPPASDGGSRASDDIKIARIVEGLRATDGIDIAGIAETLRSLLPGIILPQFAPDGMPNDYIEDLLN